MLAPYTYAWDNTSVSTVLQPCINHAYGYTYSKCNIKSKQTSIQKKSLNLKRSRD